jgi:beta-phosphoglucomutase-like phosphatase (HAD superfamily)
VAAELEVVLSEEDLRTRVFGRRTPDVLRDLFHLSPAQIERMMAAAVDDKTAEVAAGSPIVEVPGAVAFVLAAVADGFRTALVSSASAANVALALRALALEQSFELVVAADDVSLGKPAPDPYLLVADKLGIEPSTMIVFEDSVAGIVSAQAAGARCVAIASWEPAERLATADLVIGRWADWSPTAIVATLVG